MSPAQKVPQAAVVGCFQNGKSTLINCLLDDKYAPMGKGLSTTKCCCRFHYGEAEVARFTSGATGETRVLDRREEIFSPDFRCSGRDFIEISCWKPVLQYADIIDTPGFNAETEDDVTADAAMRDTDLVIFVQRAQQLGEVEHRILERVRKSGRRLLFLMNCTDFEKWFPGDPGNSLIADTIEAQLRGLGLESALLEIGGRTIWRCNPVFAWYALGHLQRDLDSARPEVRDAARYQIRKIDYTCREQGWNGADKKEKLLQASGIMEVRKKIEEIAAMVPAESDAGGDKRGSGNRCEQEDIVVACPYCGRKKIIDKSFIGLHSRCEKCGTRFPTGASAPDVKPAGTGDQRGSGRRHEYQEGVVVCPHCGRKQIIDKSFIGLYSRCEKCGTRFPTGASAVEAKSDAYETPPGMQAWQSYMKKLGHNLTLNSSGMCPRCGAKMKINLFQPHTLCENCGRWAPTKQWRLK